MRLLQPFQKGNTRCPTLGQIVPVECTSNDESSAGSDILIPHLADGSIDWAAVSKALLPDVSEDTVFPIDVADNLNDKLTAALPCCRDVMQQYRSPRCFIGDGFVPSPPKKKATVSSTRPGAGCYSRWSEHTNNGSGCIWQPAGELRTVSPSSFQAPHWPYSWVAILARSG